MFFLDITKAYWDYMLNIILTNIGMYHNEIKILEIR